MSRVRILLVDDEPAIHRFLQPTLTAAGYDVVAATTGRQAVLLAATPVSYTHLTLPTSDLV